MSTRWAPCCTSWSPDGTRIAYRATAGRAPNLMFLGGFRSDMSGTKATTLEALAAVLGGTQSLHTNSFDEAVGLPTDFSARIARNTQIIIQEESQVCHTVDPLGGSYYIEALTDGIIKEARKIIDEVEELGGMAKAIETGMPKLRVEESAARKQARIDQGLDVIVGVNKYKIDEKTPMDVLEVSEQVREEQVARINQLKADRDKAAVRSALNGVTQAAEAGGNLLAASIEAVRTRATVGEISDAMEKVFGRFVATTQCISGVYAAEYGDSEVFLSLQKRTERFVHGAGDLKRLDELCGRRHPRAIRERARVVRHFVGPLADDLGDIPAEEVIEVVKSGLQRFRTPADIDLFDTRT